MLFVLMGCSKFVEMSLAPEVTVFISGANEKSFKLSDQDEAHKALSYWLATHQDGWYSTSGKFPGGVYLVSGTEGIQVTENKVVIYTNVNSDPQATHVYEIDKNDLKIVKQLAH